MRWVGSVLAVLAAVLPVPHYAAAPRLWGLSPLDDQRLGGILMGVPAHTGLLIPFSVAFFRCVKEEADEDDEADSPAGGAPS